MPSLLYYNKVFGQKKQHTETLLLLPIRELVIFPQTIIPVYVTYKAGIDAIEAALKQDARLFAATLKPSASRESDIIEFYGPGTIVRIIQHQHLPDGSYRIVFHGESRGRILSLEQKGKITRAQVFSFAPIGQIIGSAQAALVRSIQKAFFKYAEYSKKVSTETLTIADKTDDPERLCNIIGNVMSIKPEKKIKLLESENDIERMNTLLDTLELENEILGIQKSISGKVKNRMEKNHREFILQEQLKEINKELGKGESDDDFSELEKTIIARNPSEEVLRKARKELARLRKLQPLSPEAGVLRTYLDWIADLPWSELDLIDNETEPEYAYSTQINTVINTATESAHENQFSTNLPRSTQSYTEENEEPLKNPRPSAVKKQKLNSIEPEGTKNLQDAQKILESDHYGMEKAKERVLEFIAVRELCGGNKTSEPVKGPILCFIGAPGTGKTSLGKSVARALGRRFVRISLGGVRDEAEIRGHRKTYVGALPGKIIQSMRKAGTMNPVFLLDEIDKLASDYRGDPAAALLEVLDPEQNNTFADHYLEVPYDLSRVLFIATANSLHNIPYPLLDRMEMIEIPGYGENEKLAIAKQFLIPRELEENGLKTAKIRFEDEAVISIIRHWTMESGVRSLQREIARCARRLARKAIESGYTGGSEEKKEKHITSYKKTIKTADLEKLLGRRKYKQDLVFKEARIGVSYGLAWTETGGAILPVETKSYEGNGEITITGNLGDVMKESARIALSYLRSEEENLVFTVKDIGKRDFHIHVPEGAIPKDGPSAGITLASSLLSTLCGKSPLPGCAMTGELTLTGRVLAIGGLKEKLLAAIRSGMETVLLPEDNKEDWEELDKDIKSSIKVEFVGSASAVFSRLFGEGIFRAQVKKKKPSTSRKSALFDQNPVTRIL